MAFKKAPNFGDEYAKINERTHSSGAHIVEVLYGARDNKGNPTFPKNHYTDGHGHWVAIERDGLYQFIYWRHPSHEGGYLEYGSGNYDNPLYDLETDILAKEDLCRRADSLSNLSNWNEALIKFDQLFKEWKDIFNWDTPKERELWEQFKNSKKAIYQKRDSTRENNKTAKRYIIAEAKVLSHSTEWKQTGAQFKELFEKWKKIGSAGKNEDDILWKEFNTARQEFYNNRSKYYAELDEQHERNKQKKQVLISEARNIAQYTTEWKKSGDRLRELMNDWKTIGSAGKNTDDNLWKEFNSARQIFYDRRHIYYEEQERQFQNNADRKSRIVQEASYIASSYDYSAQNTERMKRLDQDWKGIGFAGKSKEDQLWSLFQSAKDSFWSGKRAYNEQRQQEWRRKQYDAISRKRMQISNLERQISDLHTKMTGMRNQEYINNMCRWIDEKEAKIRELEIVIHDIESKL